MSVSLWFKEDREGVSFRVLVQPRAAKNRLLGLHDQALKLSLTAPPVEGAANRLCCEFLARILGRPKSTLAVTAGQKSRRKTIQAAGLSGAELRQRLQAAGLEL